MQKQPHVWPLDIASLAANHLVARARFRLRSVENWVWAGSILVIGSLIAWPLGALCFALPLLLIGAWYLVSSVWKDRVIDVACPHCGRFVASNTPWICGFCERHNENGNIFSFLYRCKHCGAEPKAYKCHHRECGQLIFLSRDELQDNYAECLTIKQKAIEDTDIDKQAREKRATEHEITMAELSNKLAQVKSRIELERKRSPMERLAKDFDEHHAHVMGAREIAFTKRKEVEEKYKRRSRRAR